MRTDKRYNGFLYERRAKKDFLIASHRGAIGAAIADNTIESFDLALLQNTDILEMDIAMTTDDELFVIHDGMEPRLLRTDKNVQTMSADEVRQFRCYTVNQVVSSQRVPTFDEVLEHLKNKCLINLDRCWIHPDEWKKWGRIIAAIEKHNMQEQVIFKSPPEEKYRRFFSELTQPFMYMPMIEEIEDLRPFLNSEINLVAVEVKFSSDESPLADKTFYDSLHEKSILTWGNAIVLGEEHILSGGHDDNIALLRDPDYGWGWFALNEFDIVQTDWPLAMSMYFSQKGFRVISEGIEHGNFTDNGRLN